MNRHCGRQSRSPSTAPSVAPDGSSWNGGGAKIATDKRHDNVLLSTKLSCAKRRHRTTAARWTTVETECLVELCEIYKNFRRIDWNDITRRFNQR